MITQNLNNNTLFEHSLYFSKVLFLQPFTKKKLEIQMKKALTHLSRDPILKPILSDKLPTNRGEEADLFNDLIRSITGQQLSTKAAATIYGRFRELYAAAPTPDQVLATEHDSLRSVGFSNQKAKYAHNVAQYFKKNQLTKAQYDKMTDDELIAQLTEIKGVGVWTVQMILMFSLGRADVFPVGDLGIKNAMVKHYNLEETGKDLQKRMVEIAEAWKPYRTYACYFLWESLNN